MTEFFGHKNLLITQHKSGQSCTLFFENTSLSEPFQDAESSAPACSPLSSGLVTITSGASSGGFQSFEF